jgi:hypothetical protein
MSEIIHIMISLIWADFFVLLETSSAHVGTKFKLKTSLTGLRTSYLEMHPKFMEHTRPSYAHILLHMSFSHCVNFEPKILFPNLRPMHQSLPYGQSK